MIRCYLTRNDSLISPEKWSSYLQLMTDEVVLKANRYLRWQDQQACVLGRLLMRKALDDFGYSYVGLDSVRLTSYGRPWIEIPLDFNIAHSGEYVICSVSDEGRVGVDIEKMRDIDINDFKSVLRPEEYAQLLNSDKCAELFFEYWSQKEAVMKADGRGFSLSPSDIHFCDEIASVAGKDWWIYTIELESDYKVALACDSKVNEVDICNISVDNFFYKKGA